MTGLSVESQSWRQNEGHRRWLRAQADDALCVFRGRIVRSRRRFSLRSTMPAVPITSNSARPLHATTRMVHCFAIGHLLGPARRRRFRRSWHERHPAIAIATPRTAAISGRSTIDGPRETRKARLWPRLRAARRIERQNRRPSRSPTPARRHQRSARNAFLGADAWRQRGGIRRRLVADLRLSRTKFQHASDRSADGGLRGDGRARAISPRPRASPTSSCAGMAGSEHWRVPEHYRADWTIDREYKGSDMFRPYGTTPGHWLEWSRLAMQLWELGERRVAWLPDAAEGLFARSDERRLGRSARRLLLHDRMGRRARAIRDRIWWPCCEGIGAAAFPRRASKAAPSTRTGIAASGVSRRAISSTGAGGWRPQLDDSLKPIAGYFIGKPDIYHALQACLIPLYPEPESPA